MATSYSDIQQLIHTYIVENTQQKITATKMREVFTRLLEYTSEHQIDNGRLHSTVAKNQPVDQRIGVAKNDTIEQLHGLPLSPALTLVMLEQEIEDLRTQINGTSPPSPIPPGVICMWSGSRAPDGWALCDGSAGRPNLLGKFIRGHNPVDSNSHSGTHSDLLAGHTIPPGTPTDGTIAGEPNVILGRSNIPTHVHDASGLVNSSEGHDHGINAPINDVIGFNVAFDSLVVPNPQVSWGATTFAPVTVIEGNGASTATVNLDHHDHDITGTTGDGSGDSLAASPDPIDIIPPYYTLAYIIKT